MGYTISDETAAEIEAAVAAIAVPKVATKECPRCNYLLTTPAGTRKCRGNGRYYNGGVCFRCGGSGVIPATRAAKVALDKAHAERELVRLRMTWTATRDLLQVAKAIADTPKPAYEKGTPFSASPAGQHYKARRAVRTLTRTLEMLEVKGKQVAG